MIIAFDLTNQQSFDSVKPWINSIYKHADPNIAKVLVGNKADLEDKRVVTKNQAQQLAAEHDMQYFETSAMQNININEVMQYIMGKVFDNLHGADDEPESGKPSISLGSKKGANPPARTDECYC